MKKNPYRRHGFYFKCSAFSTRKLNAANKSLLPFVVAMWWWIIWHLYWDWGHIVGEFPYPDTSKWTDEELGIPPDDEE